MIHFVFAVGEIVSLQNGMPLTMESVIGQEGLEFTSDDQSNLFRNSKRQPAPLLTARVP